MKVGIILHRFHDANCKPNINTFIVDVGWGQVRYFVSKVQYNIGDYVLYNEIFQEDDSSKHIKIDVICSLNECENLGNIRFDLYILPNKQTNLFSQLQY